MMRMFLFLIPFALVVLGCGDKEATEDKNNGEAHDDHAHAAKHGGELLELGDHEGFLEAKMDHDKGEVTIWTYLGEEMRDTMPTEAPVLNVLAGGNPLQLRATPGDKGAWVFAHKALKDEIEGARFRVVVGGKTYSPEWAHSHDHDQDGHDHDGHDHDGEEHDDHDHDDDDHAHDREEKKGDG